MYAYSNRRLRHIEKRKLHLTHRCLRHIYASDVIFLQALFSESIGVTILFALDMSLYSPCTTGFYVMVL